MASLAGDVSERLKVRPLQRRVMHRTTIFGTEPVLAA